jgi:voltage-gated sodium channel
MCNLDMHKLFFNLKESQLFQYLVIGIIIFNAFTIGITTYELSTFTKNIINLLDYFITIFFLVEILIRFIGEPKKNEFFKNGWNIFDTLIVLISLIPIPNSSSYLLLRLLRVFRVLRIISIIPELKLIIEALLGSVKRVFYVSLLLFIILYIYATIGSILFSNDIPQRWNDLGVSMITLFQVLTLSSWEQVMLPLQEIYWWAWIYFFSFIIICGITMLNLLIAVLVDVVINQKKL